MAKTWELAGAAWGVLRSAPGLLAVSVVAHVVALVAATVVFFVGLAVVETWAGFGADAVGWAIVAAAALVGGGVAVLGQGAVVMGADQRMQGRDPTVASALGGLRGRLGALLAWAVIATGVGRALQEGGKRGGSAGTAAASGGRFAFRVVSFLALPVILLEREGAVRSLRRSWELLKRTWGENLTFNFGLKLLGVALLAPAGAVLALADRAGRLPLSLVEFAPLLLYVVLVIAGISALSAVFKTALYRWATDAPVDAAFDREQLQSAFGQKRSDR